MGNPVHKMAQGDTRPWVYALMLQANGSAMPLTDELVRFYMWDKDTLELVVEGDAVIDDEDTGAVHFEWAVGSTDDFKKKYHAVFRAERDDVGPVSFPNDGAMIIDFEPRPLPA